MHISLKQKCDLNSLVDLSLLLKTLRSSFAKGFYFTKIALKSAIFVKQYGVLSFII